MITWGWYQQQSIVPFLETARTIHGNGTQAREPFTLSGGKEVGEKWLNFALVTKFFPDQYFSPTNNFPPTKLNPDFFSPDKVYQHVE